MPDSRVFCNSPWYELQIYWDGSLGFCCQEDHKIFPQGQESRYNVKNMSIKEWMDSEPMRRARMMMFGDNPISFCNRCYREEKYSPTSRRIRSNQKSVIFTKDNFADSYLQSPGFDKFEHSRKNQGRYDGMPIDLHIDLGNYCNLTCKMCTPSASSGISVQYIKWGMKDAKQYVGSDWTKDDMVWNKVLEELASIPNLRNVHFMGGETLITSRFEDFVDFMISAGRIDLNFSFVTNGTVFKQSLIDKLMKFQRVGIEVSIETMTKHNEYQRQGTDNSVVFENIRRYLAISDQDRITVTARPAVSLLTIGNYHTLLEYCLSNSLVVKSLICSYPNYLDARILPEQVKSLYLDRYWNFVKTNNLDNVDAMSDFNESDPHQIRKIIKSQALLAINLLASPRPDDSDEKLESMVRWCRRWDDVHHYDARPLYPELKDIFDRYGY